ncbi:hypothetical protein ACJIZ3_014864 [Penstemon smallii]|uniref:Uncharacterized protein n=1 Tax=Penstemon smallii TaxID=265156 RepID=A0ABD3RSG8_9LAMI
MSQHIGASSNKKPCDIYGCCVDCHVDLDNGNNRTYPCFRCTYATKLKTQFNNLIDDLMCEYSNGEFQMYINSFPSNMCIFEKFEIVMQFLQVSYKAGVQPKTLMYFMKSKTRNLELCKQKHSQRIYQNISKLEIIN